MPVICSEEETEPKNGLSACTSSGKLQNGTCSSENPDMNSATIHACCEIGLSEKDPFPGENLEKTSGLKEHAPLNAASSSPSCFLDVDLCMASRVSEKKKPMFLSKNWRNLLCRCSTCADFYVQKGISYLIDMEDSMEEYEKMGKEKREEKLQQQEGVELNFLNKLGHVQKIEILNGIADMKNELRSFLVCLPYILPFVFPYMAISTVGCVFS